MGRCVSSFLLPPLLLLVMVQSVSSVPIIHAPWGALQGTRMQGSGGRKMNAYLGIPYAVPPVGEMRFEKPLPHPGPGKGEVFVADKVMPACPQRPVLVGASRETSEDCLILDVYVPADEDTDITTTSTTRPYAVMVFIHGGTYVWGDASFYRPSKLVVDGKVIVVIIQYRLGVLGFLTSGNDALPGNLGLWDQNLALRWVKKNIEAFGGDHDRITIFGQSAGGWSVGLHLIIPQSRGLFKRAIMQSGAPQDLYRLTDFYDSSTIFKNLTGLVGCQGGSSRQQLRCLKQQPVDYLINKAAEHSETSPLLTYYFPVVDGELIPRKPRELVQDFAFLKENGVEDIDIILGFNRHEGAFVFFNKLRKQFSTETMYTAEFFRYIMDACFVFTGISNSAVLKKTTEFLYRRAESDNIISESLHPLVDIYGDCLFNAAIIEWARYLAVAPHPAARYMYVVDHDFAFNSQGLMPGAHHGDELWLEFDFDGEQPESSIIKVLNKTTLTEEEQSLSAKLVNMWTTFAKTGNPSGPITEDLGGEWPQFTVEEEHYLSFSGSPRVISKMGPYRDRVALWLHLLPQLDTLVSRLASQETAEDQASAREEL